MKHAYLIIAHNDPVLLAVLVEILDDERNDIYILIDKKADAAQFSVIKATKSSLVFVHRVDIRWGHISQVEAEMTLFQAAYDKGPYAYYHLLSGQDLPIKSQDYIHNFMALHHNKEYVGFAQGDFNKSDLAYKTNYFHLFCAHYRDPNKLRRFCLACLRRGFVILQQILRYHRHFDIELKKGVNWCSITNAFCAYLLSKRDYIFETFKYVSCPDEIFLQTILYNSPFRNNVYALNEDFRSCLREIDWKRGKPYLWGVNQQLDYKILTSSDKLFARKFSSANIEIVEMIKDFVTQS